MSSAPCSTPGAAPDRDAGGGDRRAPSRRSGCGFEIDAAYGAVLLPFDADTASSALQLADRRLYADKERRPSASRASCGGCCCRCWTSVNLRCTDHLEGVAALALGVGRHMGMDSEALDVLMRAAEMHDIGKMAIPETILNKPGPLDEEEWAFMRATRSSASASSRLRRPLSRWPSWCAQATSAGTGRDTRTASPVREIPARLANHLRLRRLRCDHRDSRLLGCEVARRRRSPSCPAAPARSSTQRSSRR